MTHFFVGNVACSAGERKKRTPKKDPTITASQSKVVQTFGWGDIFWHFCVENGRTTDLGKRANFREYIESQDYRQTFLRADHRLTHP